MEASTAVVTKARPGLACLFFFFSFLSFLCHYSSEFNLKEYPGEHWETQRGFTYAYLLGPESLLALQKTSPSAVACCLLGKASPLSRFLLHLAIYYWHPTKWPPPPEETRQLMRYGCHHGHLVTGRVTGFRAHMCSSTSAGLLAECWVQDHSRTCIPGLHSEGSPQPPLCRFVAVLWPEASSYGVALCVSPSEWVLRTCAIRRQEQPGESWRRWETEKLWWNPIVSSSA